MRKWLIAAAALCVAAPAQADWHEAKSKHFTVYADEDAAELRGFAQTLERFDAAVREARGVPDVQPGNATRVTLFLVRDLDELRKVYGDKEASVAGFYIPKASGSVAFIPEEGRRGEFRLSGESIFFHEYSHHLMLQDADRPLPIWLTEGFAEFFANPKFNPDGSVVIGLPPKYRAEALYLNRVDRLTTEQMLSGDFLRVTSAEWASIYGRGWLLTHLLSFDLGRRGQLTRYLNDIQAGVPAKQAAVNAFGDLRALDRELDEYFKADVFTVTTIPAAKLEVPPITVRKLTPGEAKMMSVRPYLARGGSELKAGSLAGRARGIAWDYPNDASVLTTLSQIELEADHAEAASRAADGALRLNPNSDRAILAKVRALFELAEEQPQSADWDAIRSLILKANKIDPENAEPLVLFNRTFVAQGQRPTKNALDGLIYAVVLVPRDSELRMELIGQLIDERRWGDARDALVPLAYSPHRGKWHDAVVEVLGEVEAKNAAQAKEKWSAALRFFED